MRFYEKAHIESILLSLSNDKKAAAKRLGISLSSLYRKLDELGIEKSLPTKEEE